MAHKRARYKVKVTACDLARSTSLRSMSFAESKVNRTERKLGRPKQTKVDKLRNQLLRKCAESGDLALFSLMK